MPTYDYKCLSCNYEFEQFQLMTDKLLKKCPICGGKVERLIGTGAAIIFKGSGFYETDYRSESYKKAEKADKPPSPKKDPSKKEKKASSNKDQAKTKNK